MSSFGEFKLSICTLNKISELNLSTEASYKKKLWKVVAGEYQSDKDEEMCVSQSEELLNPSVHVEMMATQYCFSQNVSHNFGIEYPKANIQAASAVEDIEQLLQETLERNNGTLDWNLLDTLTSVQVSEVVDAFSEKLSIGGILNLCKSLLDMSMEQKVKYMSIFCTKLILKKLIELDAPMRIMATSMKKLTQQFPEDIEKLIFVPILNYDLKDTSTILAIIDSFDTQKHITLFLDFISHADEILDWHLSVLQRFVHIKIDRTAKEKFIKMLQDKCRLFSRNKEYAILILTFCKTSAPFSQNEIDMLKEIAAVHGTVYKRKLENVLNEMELS